MERGYLQNFINLNKLSEVKFQESPPPTKQSKETNLALCNTIPLSSSKSERNPNKEVVSNTATTIAKPNFQGAAHNTIQKWAFTRRHTDSREPNYNIGKKTNHLFQSHEGLSTHINTLISQVWAYFVDFSRKRPPPISDHFVLYEGWSLTRELTVFKINTS